MRGATGAEGNNFEEFGQAEWPNEIEQVHIALFWLESNGRRLGGALDRFPYSGRCPDQSWHFHRPERRPVESGAPCRHGDHPAIGWGRLVSLPPPCENRKDSERSCTEPENAPKPEGSENDDSQRPT